MKELKALLSEIRELEEKFADEWLDDPITSLDVLDAIADARRDLSACVRWREADLTELKQQARTLLKQHKESTNATASRN